MIRNQSKCSSLILIGNYSLVLKSSQTTWYRLMMNVIINTCTWEDRYRYVGCVYTFSKKVTNNPGSSY